MKPLPNEEVFFGFWYNQDSSTVEYEFGLPKGELADCEFIYASCSWSMGLKHCFVIFRKLGALYRVEAKGSYNSPFGAFAQRWRPRPISAKAFFRMTDPMERTRGRAGFYTDAHPMRAAVLLLSDELPASKFPTMYRALLRMWPDTAARTLPFFEDDRIAELSPEDLLPALSSEDPEIRSIAIRASGRGRGA